MVCERKLMSKRITAGLLVLAIVSLARAEFRCPVTLVSGAGDSDSVSITFMNTGKLPVRQLEFNCKLVGGRADRSAPSCKEDNALFFAGIEYTVNYPYRGRLPSRVRVSLKSVTLAGGVVWKPTNPADCRVLNVALKKTK
jgi:hypothetical protein